MDKKMEIFELNLHLLGTAYRRAHISAEII